MYNDPGGELSNIADNMVSISCFCVDCKFVGIEEQDGVESALLKIASCAAVLEAGMGVDRMLAVASSTVKPFRMASAHRVAVMAGAKTAVG